MQKMALSVADYAYVIETGKITMGVTPSAFRQPKPVD